MKNSKKYTLNFKDIKDIVVMAFFTGLGAIGLYLVNEVLPNADFGQATPYIAPFLPIVTYGVKKYAQGK